MSKTVTLANLRTLVRLEGDFVNSLYFQDSDINLLLNRSCDSFYNLMVDTDEDYFRSTATLTLVPGTDSYSLPADFFKLKEVRGYIGSTPTPFDSIEKYNDHEKAYYSTSANQIPSLTVALEYIPTRPDLVSDSDTMDFINGLDELVIVDTCITMKDREESDVSVLMARKQELIQKARNVITYRDMNKPESTTDIHKQHSRFVPGNTTRFLRYRVIGQNIVFVTYVPPWF